MLKILKFLRTFLFKFALLTTIEVRYPGIVDNVMRDVGLFGFAK